jgi:hypothetical protein
MYILHIYYPFKSIVYIIEVVNEALLLQLKCLAIGQVPL